MLILSGTCYPLVHCFAFFFLTLGSPKVKKTLPCCNLAVWRTAESVVLGAADVSTVPHTIWPRLSGRGHVVHKVNCAQHVLQAALGVVLESHVQPEP